MEQDDKEQDSKKYEDNDKDSIEQYYKEQDNKSKMTRSRAA